MNRPFTTGASALGAWPIRVAWLVLPLVTGPLFADALAPTSRPVQVVASGGLWLGWAVVLVGTLVPRTVSLTLVRVVAPAMGVAVGLAVLSDRASVGAEIVGLVGALVVVGVAFAPSTGFVFVNGSSYGDEERFPLRIPGPVLLGPVELVWLAVAAGVVSGPLLLAVEQWVGGAVALVAGAALVWWGGRVLHGLSRRWVVLVPAGLVLHDPLALSEPVLLRRVHVVTLGPALAGTGALDLTRGAVGLALEVQSKELVNLAVGPSQRGQAVRPMEADRILFTPTRPGALLAAARARRIG